jgi:hypothetical protein
MQARESKYGQKLTPAVIAALVHGMIFAGFMSLGSNAPAPPPDAALPIVWFPAPPRAASLPFAPDAPPALALPRAITVPELPPVPLTAPAENALPALGAYVACGLGQILTPAERARCDEVLSQLYAKPGVVPNADQALALEQRFARDKALQDAPLLRACHRQSGPDPLCFVRGYETLVGSTAARDPAMNFLADPLRPR